jgi:hypothetical protein
MARSADPMSYATVAAWVYNPGIPLGVLRPDDPAMGEIADALQVAERSGDDIALSNARLTLGIALAHRQTAAESDRGQQLLAEVSEALQGPGYNLVLLPNVNVYLAHERARDGKRDEAITGQEHAGVLSTTTDTQTCCSRCSRLRLMSRRYRGPRKARAGPAPPSNRAKTTAAEEIIWLTATSIWLRCAPKSSFNPARSEQLWPS